MNTTMQSWKRSHGNQFGVAKRLGRVCKAVCVLSVLGSPVMAFADNPGRQGLLGLLAKPSPAVAAALAPELPNEIEDAVASQMSVQRPVVAYRELRRGSTGYESGHAAKHAPYQGR